MLFSRFDRRTATLIRLALLVLVAWSIAAADPGPGSGGRGILISVLGVAVVVAWLWWTAHPDAGALGPDVYVMAIGGGVLIAASPRSAASAIAFVAIVVAGLRAEIVRVTPLITLTAVALAIADLVYGNSAVGLLAYVLGFAAALLAAATARERELRSSQAELLLAQTQRSQEERLRAARLEESARIAREIHDVLAHALAGLTIQLEATRALIEQGAQRDVVLERVARAHHLAREGLEETRRAVGALRGEPLAVPDAVGALVAEYRAADHEIELTLDGDHDRLTGATGLAVLRTVQEALTNVRKHAPGARVSVAVHAGAGTDEGVRVTIGNDAAGGGGGDGASDAATALAGSGGGYGLRGMRERAEVLGGTLHAGPADGAWRVALELPAPTESGRTPAP